MLWVLFQQCSCCASAAFAVFLKWLNETQHWWIEMAGLFLPNCRMVEYNEGGEDRTSCGPRIWSEWHSSQGWSWSFSLKDFQQIHQMGLNSLSCIRDNQLLQLEQKVTPLGHLWLVTKGALQLQATPPVSIHLPCLFNFPKYGSVRLNQQRGQICGQSSLLWFWRRTSVQPQGSLAICSGALPVQGSLEQCSYDVERGRVGGGGWGFVRNGCSTHLRSYDPPHHRMREARGLLSRIMCGVSTRFRNRDQASEPSDPHPTGPSYWTLTPLDLPTGPSPHWTFPLDPHPTGPSHWTLTPLDPHPTKPSPHWTQGSDTGSGGPLSIWSRGVDSIDSVHLVGPHELQISWS